MSALNDPKWTAYLLDELTEEEKARAEAELQSDPDLRTDVEHLRETLDTLKDVFEDTASGAELDPLRKEAVLQTRPGNRVPVQAWIPTAIAAGLALFFGASQLLTSEKPTQEVPLSTGLQLDVESDMISETGDVGSLEVDGLSVKAQENAPSERNELEQESIQSFMMSDAEEVEAAPAPVTAPMASQVEMLKKEEPARFFSDADDQAGPPSDSMGGVGGGGAMEFLGENKRDVRRREMQDEDPAGKQQPLHRGQSIGMGEASSGAFQAVEGERAEEVDLLDGVPPALTPTPTPTPTPVPLVEPDNSSVK